jgi:phospholipid/cholesterol/gamma-HCH transport system permease protein
LVRSVADRGFLPLKNLLEEVGDMMILTGKTIVSALRPPYPYGGEFVSQFLFALRLCWFPLLVSTVAFGYAAPGLQAANFLVLFGAIDRLGGFFVLASVREFAPFVVAVVMAGVAGTAFTADLGARKIREELDAMMVLGIDPIQRLVVPRVLACMLVAFFLNGMVSVVGVSGGYVFNVILQDGTPGAYLASFTALAQLPDLWIGLIKALVFGLIAAVVASYKGMNAKGGPKGVGDAVNESVVITFLLLFVANFVLSMIYLQVVPPKGG